MNYVILDDYLLAEDAKRDPIGFLQRHKAPLFIDEVQYAPELLRVIKMKVDAEKRNGQYWLTSSQHFQLMQGVSESLAGRVGILDLHSMSQRECLRLGAEAPFFNPEEPASYADRATAYDLCELYRRIWRGGYPMPSKDTKLEPATFFDSYVRTYLERDVNQLAQVGNRASFLKLMQSAAMRSGQPLVYSDLARDAEVSPNTAKAWGAMLEATGIISLLLPYSTNSIKRLTKTPKLYFFRDARGTSEVDFLLVQNGKIYSMAVKRSSSPSAADLRHAAKIPPGLLELQPGIVFYTAELPYTLENNIYAFPISML